jgi:hypothetical protein
MRSISIIAAFALTTVVCAEVTPSNSRVPEAISFQTRSLRGEIYETSFRRRRPEGGIKNTANEVASDKAPVGGGNQAPPSRKRKSAGSGEEPSTTLNGSGATSTRDQPSPGTRKKRQRQNGQVDGNHKKAGIPPPYSPALLRNSASSSVSSQMSSLSTDSIGTWSMTSKQSSSSTGSIGTWSTTSKKSNTLNQPSMGTSPTFRRHNSQFVVNDNHNPERNPSKSSISFRDIATLVLTPKTSNTRNQPTMGTSSTLRRHNGQFEVNHHYNQGRNPTKVPVSFTISSNKLNTLDKQSMGPSSTYRKQNDPSDVNHHYNPRRKSANIESSLFDIGHWTNFFFEKWYRKPPANLPFFSGNIGTSGMISKQSTIHNQQSMGSLPTFQSQNSQIDVNHIYNPGRKSANLPFFSGNIGTSGMASKQSTIRNQQSMGSLPKFQSQNSQIDVNLNYNPGRKSASVPVSFFDLRTSGMTSKKSSMSAGQNSGSTMRPGFDSRDTSNRLA